eukprot:96833-Amphidinium_carterae.1
MFEAQKPLSGSHVYNHFMKPRVSPSLAHPYNTMSSLPSLNIAQNDRHATESILHMVLHAIELQSQAPKQCVQNDTTCYNGEKTFVE